jgi:hypothetical protein
VPVTFEVPVTSLPLSPQGYSTCQMSKGGYATSRKRPLTKRSGYDTLFHINLKVFGIEIVTEIEKK